MPRKIPSGKRKTTLNNLVCGYLNDFYRSSSFYLHLDFWCLIFTFLKLELVAICDDGRGSANTVRSIKDKNGVGVIHYAAAKGKINVLDYLIEDLGIDVNFKDEKGDSPLMHAIEGGNTNVVEYLLGKGAGPNASNTKGYTPLHSAAEKGHTEILARLLSKGANVNALSETGTPLDMAANYNQLEALQILLEQNANPNLCSGRSFTPLTGSIVSQSLRCIEPLLE
ncbi:hypothetical protein MKW94_002749, partial [Papaver nudicaule]|nr:hypothetical protein [Papaver nudicaule]